MPAATKKAPAANRPSSITMPARKPAETSPLDSLQHALDDLARARDQAQQDARAGIDSAVERIRDVRYLARARR